MFLFYPSISATTLRLFHFNPELPEMLLAVDYRIALDSKWRFYAIFGGVAIVVYVVGIPLWFYYILQKYKADIYDETRDLHRRAVERVSPQGNPRRKHPPCWPTTRRWTPNRPEHFPNPDSGGTGCFGGA